MADLETRFATAAADVQSLDERPDNATLLRLYALYKQATAGDVEGKRPGFANFAGRAKYDAWAELEGTDPEDAMEQYVALVDELKG
jgi:acyl-CoA-binding protein